MRRAYLLALVCRLSSVLRAQDLEAPRKPSLSLDKNWEYRIIALLLLAFACVANASSPPWRGPPITTGSGGEQLCAKHHQPLQRVTVYGPADGVCVLVQPSKTMSRQLARSPNALRFDLHRKASRLYSRAVQMSYCLRCEEEVQRAIGR
jgi:hypothetical protein